MKYNLIAICFILLIIVSMLKIQNNKETFDVMSMLERGKKICQSHKYNPWTLTFPDADEVKNIANTVLQHINKKLDMNYHLGQFDHVTKEYDLNGNTRYLIDFFSHHLDPNKINDINRRFIFDVTKMHNSNKIKINLMTVGNAKRIKHPFEDKLPELEDNELILKDTNYQNLNYVVGQSIPILDYSIINQSELNNFITGAKKDFQSWILPNGAGAIKSALVFPCRKQHKWWDSNGVHFTDVLSKSCYGINSATVVRTPVAKLEAGHGKILSDKNEYSWLFDKVRGSLSSTTPLSGSTIQ
jgi:hypothetical protein